MVDEGYCTPPCIASHCAFPAHRPLRVVDNEIKQHAREEQARALADKKLQPMLPHAGAHVLSIGEPRGRWAA